jgi:tetratricopeptide (TPR) repeat protein
LVFSLRFSFLIISFFWLNSLLAQNFQAIDTLQAVVAVRSAPDTSRTEALNKMGFLQFGLGNYKDAQRSFEQSLNITSINAKAYLGLGQTFLAQGFQPKAIITFQRGIEVAPNDATLFFALADAYEQSLDFPTAIGYARKAVSIEPDYTEAILKLA